MTTIEAITLKIRSCLIRITVLLYCTSSKLEDISFYKYKRLQSTHLSLPSSRIKLCIISFVNLSDL